MSSNPINVKINNFDMKNGMNATFNINGKDFDIMISPDDINKYFTSNINTPIPNISQKDESDNEVKGTIAIDDDNSVPNLRPEDENAIDNAAEKIFENNRNDGNKILTGLMSNVLEKLKNDNSLEEENINTIDAFMDNPTHFRHEGGGNITWVNNKNDNVNELIKGRFEKSLLGIDTTKITVHKIPNYINNNNDDDDDDNTAKMKKWKFSQFLINAAFIQQYYHNNNTVQIENLKELKLKNLKGQEYDKLSNDDDDDTSYIFSALFRIICYDNSLLTIGSLSDIVNYDGPITEYKNRDDFKSKNFEEYKTILDSVNNMETQQTTEIKHTNAEVCPVDNTLTININDDNDNNDGNNANVDLRDNSDVLYRKGKSSLPIQNIREIINNTDTDLKKDFEFLYKQYDIIRESLKTVDRGINTIRDELPGMKNIIETESKSVARDNNRLTNMKNNLKNRLNEEKGKIKTEVDNLNTVIENLEKHPNYKVIDRSIIDKIRNYKDTYTVALYQLYKKFTSIAKSNLSWSDSISNVFSRKKSGEESINNNNNNSNTGKLSGFMSAIGNVFKRNPAAGDGPPGNGGKKNRTKRLKEPRNRSLKKGNH